MKYYNHSLNKFLESWQIIAPYLSSSNDKAFFLPTHLFDQIADVTNAVMSIHNIQHLKIDYMSQNITKILGITPEFAIEKGNEYFLGRLIQKHDSYIFFLYQMIQQLFEKKIIHNLLDLRGRVCGVQYQHENGEIIKLLLDYLPLPTYKIGQKPTHYLVTIHNISHLYKRDDFWIRLNYQTQDNECKIKTLHPDFEQITDFDFISLREKEVLELLCLGKESTEIAKQLKISINTMNNHRQKLLDKIGAKDTTALIQLAQHCSFC